MGTRSACLLCNVGFCCGHHTGPVILEDAKGQGGHPEGDFDGGVKNTPGQEGPGISGREHS